MQKISKLLGLLLLTSLLFVACNKENDTTLAEAEKDEYFVDLAEATQIANHLGQFLKEETSQRADNASIADYEQIADRSGKTSFYAFNYERGGFLLLSADKRVKPMLAFSDENNFLYNRDEMHPGLLEWLDEVNTGIYELCRTRARQAEEVRGEWNVLNSRRRPFPIDDDEGPGGPGGCEEWYIQRGPLLATTWDQWCTGFNDLAPACSNWCGRVPIGCVATAMGQVIRFHEHPGGYNYASMNNANGGGDTPQLLFDAAEAVDMDYDCAGSGASMSDARSALDNDFSYSSAIHQGFDRNKVRTDIDNGRPVILAGYNSSSGHAWVCDGYKRWQVCIYDSYGNLITAIVYLHLHMNWGWDGTANGWYAYNNWNPLSTHYNNDKEMIYRIIP